MNYVSTRNAAHSVTATQAIIRGLAPDGGLYVPETIPRVDLDFVRSLSGLSFKARAVKVLSLYLDEFTLEELTDIADASYGENFDHPDVAPLHKLEDDISVLELWHGPTSAFKDMALQIMPRLLTASLRKNGETRTASILVATSGDTGKAAMEGFRDVPGTRIMVFYPRDGVSEVQKLQMSTQEGDNVNVVAVDGNFDDAQTGVKKIFGDADFASELDGRGFFLSSANSINWGRLVPQIAYYFSAYCDYVKSGAIQMGDQMDFCVPTGNFGNILAGWYAKQMGLPVRRLICASNANCVLTYLIRTGVYNKKRPFNLTISPSMDILVSSNLERLLYCLSGDSALVCDYMRQLSANGRYELSPALKAAVQAEFAAGYCPDDETMACIGRLWREEGYLADTHTAVALQVLYDTRRLEAEKFPTVVISTASPFKFCGAVLEALGALTNHTGPALVEELSAVSCVDAPDALAKLIYKKARFGAWVTVGGMKKAVGDFLK